MVKVWVFGYGSLMWDNSEYKPYDVKPAVLEGAHRSFNIKSTRQRGSSKNPGVVLGLDFEGVCVGKAILIDEKYLADVDEREAVSAGVYKRIKTPDKGLKVLIDGKVVECFVYMTNPESEQYIGKLPIGKRAEMAVNADKGLSGTSVEYIKSTKNQLDKMGIPDSSVDEFWSLISKKGEKS